MNTVATDYDVIIVGAGLAGLRAAQVLDHESRRVLLLEASNVVGGRVRSDVVDGYTIDRGFQLINPSYPELRRACSLGDLNLRSFKAAVVLHQPGGDAVLRDPRRSPFSVVSTLRAWPGSARDLFVAARMIRRVVYGQVAAIETSYDCSTYEGLTREGFSHQLIEELWQPFLSGVLLRDDLATSWRFGQLALRSFFRGRPGVPGSGMGALPALLASSLRHVECRLNSPVSAVSSSRVHVDGETLSARVVIVAADASSARRLLPSLPEVERNGVTTWWFACEKLQPVARLRLDLVGRRIANALDLTAAAPSYAPAGRSLLAASVVGDERLANTSMVRSDVARLYGVSVSDLEEVAVTDIPEALPDIRSPLTFHRSVDVDGVIVAGDYLETPSLQGALVSGRRAGTRALSRLNNES